MKWAKVSKGRVHHVWPKIKPDGRVVEWEYGKLLQKAGKPIPPCFVQVPDHVKENWIWYEDRQEYGPVIKQPLPPRRTYKEVLYEAIDKRIDVKLAALKDEILAAIKAGKD